MFYNLTKSTELDRNYTNWGGFSFAMRSLFLLLIWNSIEFCINLLIFRIFRYNILVSSNSNDWDFYWETRKEYYQQNDQFKEWLNENKICYYQSFSDVRAGLFRFRFLKQKDMVAFKLRWR